MLFDKLSSFGKRKLERARAESDSVNDAKHEFQRDRIFSKELWDDPKIAPFFGLIDAKYDDPDNFLPTQDIVNARMDALLAKQSAFVNSINSQYDIEHALVPYAMTPYVAWSDERIGHFLLTTCKVYPAEPWNTMLLPNSEEGQRFWGLPQYSETYPDAYIQATAEFLVELYKKYETELARLEQALIRGSAEFLEDFGSLNRWATDIVLEQAKRYALVRFGSEIFCRHEQLFAKTLGREGPVAS